MSQAQIRVLPLVALLCLATPAVAVVRVALREEASAGDTIVTIGDVADLHGGQVSQRRQIAQLDIAALQGREEKRISKSQVRLRIMLAGIDPARFQVTGASTATIRSAAMGSNAETGLLEDLKRQLAAYLGRPTGDIRLVLLRPLSKSASRLLAQNQVEMTLPTKVAPGPLTVKLRILDAQRLLQTSAVLVELQLASQVFVAQSTLPVGHTVTEADVRSERRFLGRSGARDLATAAIGERLQRGVLKGAVLRQQDMVRQRPKRPEIVIRSRAVVDVIARKNKLQVKISGLIALSQGAVGDTIRVKNPSTQTVFTAKVVNSNTVEIRL